VSAEINIPALFAIIAAKVNTTFSSRTAGPFPVYFEHGVYDAVNRKLVMKSEGITDRVKYPLIWLVTPINQKPITSGDANCEIEAQFFILCSADSDASEDDQIANYFTPYLRPIYKELLNQIDRSCLFQVLSAESIIHEMKEWTYQSTTDGKKHLFNDYVNAIQVKGMSLLVNEPPPNSFKIFNS
jgi:hypothetical protein